MQDAQTWRELLATIINDSKERQRIVDELNITSITLTRWVNGESAPRPHNLRRLIEVLPAHQEQLRALLKEEKGLGEFASVLQDESFKEIPTEFYGRVLVSRATVSENLRFWSICNMILQQALGQLDPERLGMSIWVVRCMPPSGPYAKVRSLRESIGIGTPPWSSNLEQTAMFLGAESLAGNVVTLCRPGLLQDMDEEMDMRPTSRVEHEKSAAIYPILYAGRIAGVLLVSSTRKNYFLSSACTDLVQRYADLVALAFDPKDFYTSEQIALNVMPSHEQQKAYFARFRQLLAETMVHAARENQPVNNAEADILVWQQLEEKLLKIPMPQDTPVSTNGKKNFSVE